MGAVPSSQYIPAVNVNIGRRSGGYYFQGVIDDVSIYNRALSQAEIQNNMSIGVAASTSLITTSALTPLAVQGPIELNSADGASNREGRPSRLTGTSVSRLSCSPRSVKAGSQVTCELVITGSAVDSSIHLSSNSSQVRIPNAVATRANQSRLTFQASVDAAAKEQAVTVTASLNGASVQDMILVMPSSVPILTVPGKQFARFGAPLSFQITAVDPLDSPVQVLAAGIPAGASFDPSSGRFDWTPTSSQAGLHQLTFKAINGVGQSSTAQVSIDVDSGTPLLTGSAACSPGAIGTLRGKWLVNDGKELADATGKSLTLAGTTIKVNGEPAPVLFVSPTWVNFSCPSTQSQTQLSLAVETTSGASEPLTVEMKTVSPEIFSFEGAVPDQGVISFSETADIATERNAHIAGHPAQPDDEILIWGTGFGAAAGASSTRVSVRIGEVDAEVMSVRAVPGYAGIYTIQTRVPARTAIGALCRLKSA